MSETETTMTDTIKPEDMVPGERYEVTLTGEFTMKPPSGNVRLQFSGCDWGHWLSRDEILSATIRKAKPQAKALEPGEMVTVESFTGFWEVLFVRDRRAWVKRERDGQDFVRPLSHLSRPSGVPIKE